MFEDLIHMHKTQYWKRLEGGRVQCTLCPRFCSLRDGKRGACYVRMAHQGQIVLTSYGLSSGLAIDPIEKKPLNHFYPGSSVLSFGTAGCNLACKFCQNWKISKSRDVATSSVPASPMQIAELAKAKGCKSVAFTYNDPVIFMEYAIDVAKACHELDIKTVLVTAAYINPEPRKKLFAHMDAANVDLKAFSEGFYRKLCKGQLAPVLDSLLYIVHETDIWLEITTLLIPDENDSDKELSQMCEWLLTQLGAEIPLHFSAFHPDYKLLDKPPTAKQSLINARNIALETGLKHVYLGNVHDLESDTTVCSHCGFALIERDWYRLVANRLDEQGACPRCKGKLAGRF